MSKMKRPGGGNEISNRVIADVQGEAPNSVKNPAAVALGRLGGLKGGKARAKKLSPERRKEIAKLAAEARWKSNEDE